MLSWLLNKFRRNNAFNLENGSLFREYIAKHAEFLKVADTSNKYSFDEIVTRLEDNDKKLWDRIAFLKTECKDLYNKYVD